MSQFDRYFAVATSKDPTDYKVGEEIVLQYTFTNKGTPIPCPYIHWRYETDDGQQDSGYFENDHAGTLTLKLSMSVPGYVHAKIVACDRDKNELEQAEVAETGVLVEPEKIRTLTEMPADFDAFWDKQVAALEACTPVLLSKTPIDTPKDRPGADQFHFYDVVIDCIGGKPVCGTLTVPKDAAPGSCDAVAYYLGAGVYPAGGEFMPNTLCLQINAHGIPNTMPKAYYEDLDHGKLKNYGGNDEENKSPETCYFLPMALRAAQATRFLRTLPEWNGKLCQAQGGSQGGYQAVCAATLDKGINLCTTRYPWITDVACIHHQRLAGAFPFDKVQPGITYLDAALLATRITCKTQVYSGLGDTVCMPSGTVALYNNLIHAKEKECAFMQNMIHGCECAPNNPIYQIKY